ncbi:unnamed protein product [Strongylus vulgaris]|uniref:Fatty-acid and retinol-binding protein 1 n=1 Tax=Strongylus vulgaris TaxID=40348 RepID=A0A3P7IVQ9_STRVU|nr:unnamed protein product [Strongylus vulgaris]
MGKSALIISSFIIFASALEVSDIPPEYRALLPKDLNQFIRNLSEEEKLALLTTFKNRNEPIEERLVHIFIAEIKKKSPQLGNMVERASDIIRDKIAALNPEAQAFAQKMRESGIQLVSKLIAGKVPSIAEVRKATSTLLTNYKELSIDAQEDYRKKFPLTSIALTGISRSV